MRKRLTSILLTLAMLVGLLPALSPQAEAAADDATALLQEVSTKTSVPSGYTPIYDAEDLQNMQKERLTTAVIPALSMHLPAAVRSAWAVSLT